MNLKENIARMELELADMKKQLKQQDKLELKGGSGYWLQTSGTPIRSPYSTSKYVERGAVRHKKELAEVADKNMVTRNRLEAHVHQLQGDDGGVHIICKEHDKYRRIQFDTYNLLGAVYMAEETAEILCEALNRGEIEL